MRNLLILTAFLVLGINISYALTVGPAKIEFVTNPGETINFNLFVRNDSEWDSEYFISIEGFSEINGEIKFFENPLEKDWFKIQDKLFLKSKEDVQIPVEINIPSHAQPGGHFLAIWVSGGSTSKEKGQVGIIGRVASLIFINVKGNAIYRANISKFEAKKFVWKFPVKFVYLIKNEGNTYIKPKGYINIKNILGKNVAVLPINSKEFHILPGTEKRLETEWQGEFAFGVYKAVFDMIYGENNNLNFDYWFVFLNLNYLIIILILVIFVIFILPLLVKKYNAYIIKKYTQKDE